MKPLSENLTALISTVEDLVRRPAYQMPNSLSEALANLASEIRQVHALPCDGIRSTRAGIVMCEAIEGFIAAESGDDRWLMLMGATLPLLRREAWQARRNEKEAASETQR